MRDVRAFRRGRLSSTRLLAALVVAALTLISYWGLSETNEVTGEVQRVDLTRDQEIALGLQSAPEMAAQHGGISADAAERATVERVGRRVVERSRAGKSDYPFVFHVLADRATVNAFALPGGQVFVTAGLLERLETEGQLAAVLAHEIAHVVGRHGAEHLAKARLAEGLTGAAVLATYDPSDPRSRESAAVAAMVAQLVQMRFGREDELESDRMGAQFASEAGYDPRASIALMGILAQASGRSAGPEFFSTHPSPEGRVERLEEAIRELFPEGVPADLTP